MIRFIRTSVFIISLILSVMYAGAANHAATDSLMPPDDLPVYDSAHPARIVRFTPVFAVGGSSSVNNYKHVIPGLTDMQTAPGIMFRAGIHVNFFIHRSLAITTGLEGSVSNSRVAIGMIDNTTHSISSIFHSNHYYEAIVPVGVSFRLNMGWRIKSIIGVGAYLSKGLGGYSRTSGYTSGTNSLGQSVINHLYYKKDYYSDSMPLINSVKNFDFGPRLSAGFLYRDRISMKYVFQISTRNLSFHNTVLDIRYRHISSALEIGYIF